MIGRLVRHLEKLSILDDTVIYIVPDHHLMGTTGEVVAKLNEEGRGLFFLTNADPKNLPFERNEKIYQLDLPRLIIDGAEINTNASFLTDYIERMNIEEYLASNVNRMAQLNEAAISRENFSGDLEIRLNKSGLSIKSDEASLYVTGSSRSTNRYQFVFGENMNLLYSANEVDQDDKIYYQSSNKLVYMNVQSDANTGLLTVQINNGMSQYEIKGRELVKIDVRLIGVLLADFENRRTEIEINLHASQVERYIAHAGGAIDGKLYTDSMEALDNSYASGFRLFELDIIETSDGQFVAAHDWKLWSEMTGYEGDIPPDLAEFKRHKIYGRYTPLDMEAINKWFAKHEDAMLVTDKVNSPSRFSEQFVDKSRLKMELFTWDAVLSATDIDPEIAMPNAQVLALTGLNALELLRKYNIKSVAASREIIANNRGTFLDLMKHNIRVYVFHVEDELYTLCKDLDYVYGMYADEWSFPSEVYCQ
jgi:glycerophosphoryl diester phosphodiesterase